MNLVSTQEGTVRKPNLVLWAALFLFFYTAAISVSSGIRLHSESLLVKYNFFIPYVVWLLVVLLLQHNINKNLPNRDPLIFPIIALLTGIGLLTIWRLSPSLGQRQTIWLVVSAIAFSITVNNRRILHSLRRYKYIWLFGGIFLLGLTFLIGVNPQDSGPNLWLHFLRIYFQPSELIKLLVIIYLASFFSDQIRSQKNFFGSIFPTLIIAITVAVMLVSQHDLGTALLIVCLYVLMITITTHHNRFLWLFPLLLAVLGVLGYFLSSVVRSRVDIWLHPWIDTNNASYQLVQGQIAVASGGLLGTGPGLGSPYIVPVAVSDFIYTTIAEELGFVGGASYLILMLLLVIRGIVGATRSKSSFGRYLGCGLSFYFGLQTVIIVSGNLGLIPLTGITLPFLSYGGSALLINFIAAALLVRVSMEGSVESLPSKTKQPYLIIGTFFMVVFGLLLIRHLDLAFFRQRSLLSRPENPRWAVWDQLSPRGTIYSQSGKVLAESTGKPGNFSIVNHYPELSHSLGYASGLYGQTGLQKSMYRILRGLSREDYHKTWLSFLLYNQPASGLDLKVNISLDYQKRAVSLLGDTPGAIVLMNANSGEIYAIASHPGFDSNNLEKDWATLITREDAPLVNRATQGQYPIGTLSNLLFTAADLQQPALAGYMPDTSHFVDPYCLSAMNNKVTKIETYRFGCWLDPKFTSDGAYLQQVAQLYVDLGLTETPELDLETSAPEELIPTETELSYETLAHFKITPMQAALMASAITNNGTLPEAKLVNSYKEDDGSWRTLDNAVSEKAALSSSLATSLRNKLSDPQSTVWTQIGQAADKESKPLSWAIGGHNLNWSGTKLSAAVILEEYNPVRVQEIINKLLSPID